MFLRAKHLFLAALLACANPAFAATETIIHKFVQTQGHVTFVPPTLNPSLARSIAPAGTLFGVTTESAGGTGGTGHGSIFMLTPPSAPGGKWGSTVLHFFGENEGADSQTQLVADSSGNLYGATLKETTFDPSCPAGCGLVFKLAPPAKKGGAWVYSVLHRFHWDIDGAQPLGLTLRGGSLYGITHTAGKDFSQCSQAGSNPPEPACGTVFKLSPPASGSIWKFTTIYRFQSSNLGTLPVGAPIFDADGNLYVATPRSTQGYGAILKLEPSAGAGFWRAQIAHHFDGTDGSGATGRFALGSDGTIYGTATGSTTNPAISSGVVFSLKAADPSQFEVLGGFSDGNHARAGLNSLVIGPGGSLYGTTFFGGPYLPGSDSIGQGHAGSIYKLTPNGSSWTKAILHDFMGQKHGDGAYPNGVILSGGKLYGTTNYGVGTVFMVSLP